MNNRTFLILIIVLSCAFLLVGGGLIGAALSLQGRSPLAGAFPTPATSDALLTPDTQAGAPKQGAPAPDLTLTTPDGKTVKLSDFHGKPMMINFWASLCGPCTAEMKSIESVYQQHTNDDFVILGVNQGEGDDTIKGYGELWKLHFRLLRDGGNVAQRLYHIQALPTTVFIDAQGNISEIHVGGPMSTDFIEQHVKAMLANVK